MLHKRRTDTSSSLSAGGPIRFSILALALVAASAVGIMLYFSINPNYLVFEGTIAWAVWMNILFFYPIATLFGSFLVFGINWSRISSLRDFRADWETRHWVVFYSWFGLIFAIAVSFGAAYPFFDWSGVIIYAAVGASTVIRARFVS